MDGIALHCTRRALLGVATGVLGTAPASGHGRIETGVASWYGGRWHHGRLMANGRRFDELGHSAAHRTLPFGTRARVTNLLNGRTDMVTIEDRGPYIAGRMLDVSRGTAQRLGMIERGLAPVRFEVVS